jgi:hypothetical protein
MIGSAIAIAGVLLIGIVTLALRVVVSCEYPWWGRLLAARLCRLASAVARPRGAEWRSLLAERQSQTSLPCVLFAFDLLLASIRLRVAHVYGKTRSASWASRL